jgi:hypothetical protein
MQIERLVFWGHVIGITQAVTHAPSMKVSRVLAVTRKDLALAERRPSSDSSSSVALHTARKGPSRV